MKKNYKELKNWTTLNEWLRHEIDLRRLKLLLSVEKAGKQRQIFMNRIEQRMRRVVEMKVTR